jgi:phosphate transport system substrate-binding protein
MIKRLIVLAALAVFAGGLMGGCGKNEGDAAKKEVKMEGSTTVLPLVMEWTHAFQKKNEGMKIILTGTGSGAGIKSLIDGTVGCAMSSRKIKDDEKKQCKDKGFDAVEHEVAWDCLTFIVSKDNPMSEITKEQLAAIYTGGAKTWKEAVPDLNFDQKIVVVTREQSSGTFEYFNESILEKKKLRDDAQSVQSSQDVINLVAQTKGAVGYVGVGYYIANQNKVKALKFKSDADGKYYMPTDYGKYPVTRPLFLYSKGQPAGILADFIKFALSEEGQQIVDKAGFIPLAKIKQ